MIELIITTAACLFSIALFAWHLRRVARIDREYREQAQAMRDQHAREDQHSRKKWIEARRILADAVAHMHDDGHRARRLEEGRYADWKAKRADITERAKGVEW